MVMFAARRSMTLQLDRVSLFHPQVSLLTSKSQLAFTRARGVVVGRVAGVRVIGTIVELGLHSRGRKRESLTLFTVQQNIVDGDIRRQTRTSSIG